MYHINFAAVAGMHRTRQNIGTRTWYMINKKSLCAESYSHSEILAPVASFL